MAIIQNEKYTLGIVNNDGTPKIGVLVELKINSSTFTLSELGNGKYKIDQIPTGKYFVWVDGVSTGESVSVGAGQVSALGNEADAFLIGVAGNWAIRTIQDVKILLNLDQVSNIEIPDPVSENGKVLAVLGDQYVLITPTNAGASSKGFYVVNSLAEFESALSDQIALNPEGDCFKTIVIQETIFNTTPSTIFDVFGSQINIIAPEAIAFVNSVPSVGGSAIQFHSIYQNNSTLPNEVEGCQLFFHVPKVAVVGYEFLVGEEVGFNFISIEVIDPTSTSTDLQVDMNGSPAQLSFYEKLSPDSTDQIVGDITQKYWDNSFNDSDFLSTTKTTDQDVKSKVTFEKIIDLLNGLKIINPNPLSGWSTEIPSGGFVGTGANPAVGTGLYTANNFRLFDSFGQSVESANSEIKYQVNLSYLVQKIGLPNTTLFQVTEGQALFNSTNFKLPNLPTGTPVESIGFDSVQNLVRYPIVNFINPRVVSVVSTTNLNINSSTTDQFVVTAQSGPLTIATPTGSIVDGQKLIIRIKALGVSVITWNSIFRIIGTTLPTQTTANKTIYIGVIYNSLDVKYDVVSVIEEL